MKTKTYIIAIISGLLKPRNRCQHIHTHTYVEEVAATVEKVTITCLSCKQTLSTKHET